jgi:hypothetical protein
MSTRRRSKRGIYGVGGCKEARTKAHREGDYEPGDERDDPLEGVDKDTLLFRIRKIIRQIERKKKDLIEYIGELDSSSRRDRRVRRAYPDQSLYPYPYSQWHMSPVVLGAGTQMSVIDPSGVTTNYRHAAKKELKHLRELQSVLVALEEQVRCGIPLEGREYDAGRGDDDDYDGEGYDLLGMAKLVLDYPDLERLQAAMDTFNY